MKFTMLFRYGIIFCALTAVFLATSVLTARQTDSNAKVEDVETDKAFEKSDYPPEFLKIVDELEKSIEEKGGVGIIGRAKFSDGTPIKKGDLDFSVASLDGGGVYNCYGWRDGWFYTRNLMPGAINKRILLEAKDSSRARIQAYALNYDPSPPTTFKVRRNEIHYLELTLDKTPEDKLIRISGTVFDEYGEPMRDARVRLTIAATTAWSGDPSLSVSTDENGRYEFPPITPQRYSVSASKAGCASEGGVVDPEKGSVADNDFALYKLQKVRFDYVYQPDGGRDFTKGNPETITFDMSSGHGGFCFEKGKTANDGEHRDIYLNYRHGKFSFQHFFVTSKNGSYDAGEVPFESVKEAKEGLDAYKPKSEYGYNRNVELDVKKDHVYVVRTYDGKYAKLIVRDFVPVEDEKKK